MSSGAHVDESAFEAFVSAVKGKGDLGKATARLFDAAKKKSGAAPTALLARLDPVLRAAPDETVGRVALLAGALVEIGADATAFPMGLFDVLGEFLDQVSDEVPPAHEGNDAGPMELPQAFYQCEQAAAALLSRSVDHRRALPQKGILLGKIRRYSERYGFLGKMLAVLDDAPLTIIHPSTGRAWRARMGGVADNFQLHALLRAVLAGDGPERIEGERPDAELIATFTDGPVDEKVQISSKWQLAQWRAIRPDGSLPGVDDTSQWIWNEGFPAEIEVFEGARVVAIGPSSITRSWNAGRIFDGMRGWLTVETMLTPDDTRTLLARIAAGQVGA